MSITARISSKSDEARQRLGRRLHHPTPGIPLEAAVPFLPADPVIVEAGASTGVDLSDLARVWPEATIHAFEPEPTAYQQLAERASGMPQVQPWNLALGTDDGTITLNVSHGRYATQSSSLLTPGSVLDELPETTFTTVDVTQQTLASWAAEYQVDRIDLLALDMQGYEHPVLVASPEILRSARVVITEAFLQEMYEGASTIDQLQALLTSSGFVIVETNLYWGTTQEVMAVRRDALEAAVMAGLDTKRGFLTLR
jgi:FkbM family methyltransferase